MARLLPLIGLFAVCLPCSAEVIYVSAEAGGANDGTSWADAYTSLPVALDTASDGDELWVAAGTYAPIMLKSGVKVLGGFEGTETSASQSDPDRNPTYISGRGTSRAVTGVNCAASTVLRGLTITDGVLEDIAEPGGGLYLEDCDVLIVRCTFTNNTVRYAGGAAANYGGSPTFLNCRFVGNGYVRDIEPVGGGAFFNYDGDPTFVNCLFHGNRAGDGGAVVSRFGRPQFINCTFSANEAAKRFGGAIFDNPGTAVVRNSILWANAARQGGSNEIYNNHVYGKTDIAHSNVQGGWSGTGNIDADPLFVDAAAGDFRLRGNSPCRDTGRSEYLPPEPAELNLGGSTASRLSADLRMNARVEGDAADMGAFERGTADP